MLTFISLIIRVWNKIYTIAPHMCQGWGFRQLEGMSSWGWRCSRVVVLTGGVTVYGNGYPWILDWLWEHWCVTGLPPTVPKIEVALMLCTR